MSQEIYYSEASQLVTRFLSKELSPVEVMQAHVDRIEAMNPKLNSIVTLNQELMHQAQKAETAIMKGEIWGPIHGVPFTIKDLIDTKNLRTSRGSIVFADHVSKYDATVVKRLKDAGGILLGKTNTPEFGFWWETGNRLFGTTNNPWNLERTSGGSSGGEATSIAAGMSPFGVGSDVGGSIRQPASYCGVVGLKPTHGRIPLTGHFPEIMQRFMHVGPIARTVKDATLMFSLLTGPDGLDPYAMPVPLSLPDFDFPLPKLKIAWCSVGPFAPVSREVQLVVEHTAKTLSKIGCDVEQVSLSRWPDAQSISMSFFLGDGVFMLKSYFEGNEEDLTWYFKARLERPKPTIDEYISSIKDTEILRSETAKLFSDYDLLIVPTAPTAAHEHEVTTLDVDGQMVEPRNSLRVTVPFDLTGSPSINIPMGFTKNGLPVGIQIVGKHFDEATVLTAAAALESERGEFPHPEC